MSKKNGWLAENLVCPCDYATLEAKGNLLVCPRGHSYPLVDGIPVMLKDNADPTAWWVTASLLQAYRLIGLPKTELKGSYIRAAREATGLSLEEFAERFGFSANKWDEIERTGHDNIIQLPPETASPVWNFINDTFDLQDIYLQQFEPKPNEIPEYVQNIVASTCGYLYAPLVGKLTSYPIPELRLPAGSGETLLDIWL